jgi:hypothetical protein
VARAGDSRELKGALLPVERKGHPEFAEMSSSNFREIDEMTGM